MTASMESRRMEDGAMSRAEAEKELELLTKQEVLMTLSFIAGIMHEPSPKDKREEDPDA